MNKLSKKYLVGTVIGQLLGLLVILAIYAFI